MSGSEGSPGQPLGDSAGSQVTGADEPEADDDQRFGPAHAGQRRAGIELVRAALADRLPPALRLARWQLSGRAAAGVALVLAVAVATAWFVARPTQPRMLAPGTPVAAVTTSAALATTVSATASVGVVVVDVAGQVASPGVYELPAGSRVIDALTAAGGALPGVETATLNLARVLVDGEQIAVGVPPATDAAAPGGPGGESDPGTIGAPLDLNTATESELDALPGVGPVLAARIIAWRDEHGRFSSVDELLEVSGIGTATMADLTPLVRV